MRSWFAIVLILSAGCHSARAPARTVARTAPASSGLSSPQYLSDLRAAVVPPLGWHVGQREDASAQGHRVWVSPSGRTAYGVIRFSLPLPVGHDPVLWVFLGEMKRQEGEASLLEKRWDANRRILRFVAQGGKYTVRTNLLVRGFSGWAVYAGTLTREAVAPEELTLAELARENTLLGREARDSAGE